MLPALLGILHAAASHAAKLLILVIYLRYCYSHIKRLPHMVYFSSSILPPLRYALHGAYHGSNVQSATP